MAARAIPERLSTRHLPPRRWLLASFITAALAPALVQAQTVPVSPARTAPWDVTAVAGFLSSHPPEPNSRGYVDDWFTSAQAGVLIGRHLTPHLKVDLDLTTSSEGRRYVEHYTQAPGYPYPVAFGSEQFSRVHEIGAALTYQFFDNEWIHPFVQAGAVLDFDRERSHTWAQSFYAGDPRQPGTQVVAAPETTTAPTTTVHARAVFGGGAKFYLTERLFVRTDGRFAFGANRQQLALRLGFGVDF